MKALFSIFLIILAIAVFFLYIDPGYEDVKVLRAEEGRYDEALERSEELIALRDGLLSKYNAFSMENLERLEKLLPDTIDNVRLILDLDGIARTHGVSLNSVVVNQLLSAENDTSELGVMELSFSIQAPYETFKDFLVDLEDSLRVVDVRSITFSGSDEDNAAYLFVIETYWLK